MDLEALPAALAAARARLEATALELPDRAAAVILAAAHPPRRTGALAATGRVEDGAVTYGSPRVDYVLPVLAANPFLTRAELEAAPAVLELTAAAVETATTL